MTVRAVFAIAAMAFLLPTTGQAQALRSFCAAAQKPVDDDPRLNEAVAATFGPVIYSSQTEGCVYPLKVLHYTSADVLLTQGNVPGEACHGCGAKLSASVLQRTGGGLKLVKRLPDFASAGTYGSAGDVSPLTMGGDDGLVIEGGGTFQGYSSSSLDFYVFRAGRVIHIEAGPPIALSASNAGAMTDDSKFIDVSGSWSIDAASKANVVVDYTIKARGQTKIARVVWTLQGSRLLLTKGRVPAEVGEAGGGG